MFTSALGVDEVEEVEIGTAINTCRTSLSAPVPSVTRRFVAEASTLGCLEFLQSPSRQPPTCQVYEY